METDTVQQIALVLQRAAGHRRLLPYQRFHALFNGNKPLDTRYAALERAVALLEAQTGLDYGVLLTLDNGLPGAEFFRRFKRSRHTEFLAVMGGPLHENSLKKKRLLVVAERERVFADAAARVVADADSHA